MCCGFRDLKVAEYRPYHAHRLRRKRGTSFLPTSPREPRSRCKAPIRRRWRNGTAFCRDYDPDGAIVTANDNNELGIPNPYYIPYGCYSWDMVDKLDEIVQKYDLKLLSPDVGCQYYESSVLFSSLGIDGVFHGDVEYLSGYFYPEGNVQYRAAVPAGYRPVAI